MVFAWLCQNTTLPWPLIVLIVLLVAACFGPVSYTHLKMKKILATILTLGMLLSLAACANGGSTTSTNNPTDNPSATVNPDIGGTVGSTKAAPNCNEDGLSLIHILYIASTAGLSTR